MRTGTPRSMSRTGRSAASSRAGSPEQGANGLNDTYKVAELVTFISLFPLSSSFMASCDGSLEFLISLYDVQQ